MTETTPLLEIRGLHGYCDRYRDNMTKPHRHFFYQSMASTDDWTAPKGGMHGS